MLREVKNEADVEGQVAVAADAVRRRVEDLATDRRELRHLSLSLPADIPVVLVPGTRIDPVASTAVRHPRPEALLKPERNERAQGPGGLRERRAVPSSASRTTAG